MKTVSEVDVFSFAPFMLLKISRTVKPICGRMRDSQLSRMSDRQIKQKHAVSNAKVHSCDRPVCMAQAMALTWRPAKHGVPWVLCFP